MEYKHRVTQSVHFFFGNFITKKNKFFISCLLLLFSKIYLHFNHNDNNNKLSNFRKKFYLFKELPLFCWANFGRNSVVIIIIIIGWCVHNNDDNEINSHTHTHTHSRSEKKIKDELNVFIYSCIIIIIINIIIVSFIHFNNDQDDFFFVDK